MNIFQQREQILANLIEAYREHDEEKTNHLLGQLRRRAKEIKGKAPDSTDLGRKKL